MKLAVSVAAAVAAFTMTAAAGAKQEPGHQDRQDRQQQASRALVAAAAGVRHTVWACQDHIGQPRTRASLTDQQLLTAVGGYLVWIRRTWEQRLAACSKAAAILADHQLADTDDWNVATIQADRVYPGVRGWLLSCSSGEGGHGRFVWNTQGSGAGGWMQFMQGTYDAYENAALNEVRSHGWVIPPGSTGWYRPLGQALVAGYMRVHGWSHIHWAPSLDSGCW